MNDFFGSPRFDEAHPVTVAVARTLCDRCPGRGMLLVELCAKACEHSESETGCESVAVGRILRALTTIFKPSNTVSIISVSKLDHELRVPGLNIDEAAFASLLLYLEATAAPVRDQMRAVESETGLSLCSLRAYIVREQETSERALHKVLERKRKEKERAERAREAAAAALAAAEGAPSGRRSLRASKSAPTGLQRREQDNWANDAELIRMEMLPWASPHCACIHGATGAWPTLRFIGPALSARS